MTNSEKQKPTPPPKPQPIPIEPDKVIKHESGKGESRPVNKPETTQKP